MEISKQVHRFLKDEITTLEYAIKRMPKEDMFIKNLCHSIVEKFDCLNFDSYTEQPVEFIQSLQDFNIIHNEYELKYVEEDRFNYWQGLEEDNGK